MGLDFSKQFNLDHYDDYMKQRPIEQRFMIDFIVQRYKEDRNIRILEFGAGNGRFTKYILEVIPKINITLVEPDLKCCDKLKILKKKYKQIKIVNCLAEKFSSDNKFEIIVMATAFHHISFEKKTGFLRNIRKLLNPEGYFLCSDNFLAEYKTMEERNIVLKKSINKWMREARFDNDETDLVMAIKMKDLVFRSDFGGEYLICPSVFERYLAKAGLKIKGKVNVTNTNPHDFENYFYLLM